MPETVIDLDGHGIQIVSENGTTPAEPTGVAGKMVQDNFVLISSYFDFSDDVLEILKPLVGYYTRYEMDDLLEEKANSSHNHDTRYYQKALVYTKPEVDTLITTSHNHDTRYYLKQQLYIKTEVDALLADKSDTTHTHDDRYYTESEMDTLLLDKADYVHSHNDLYYTESEVNSLLSGKSDTGHSHNDLYYTESEITSLLSGKSDTGHTHDDRYYTESEINNLISTHTTKLAITGSISASTNFSVTTSGTNYTHSGDSASLKGSESEFNGAESISIFLNGVRMDKGVEANWISSTAFYLNINVDDGDIIIVLT